MKTITIQNLAHEGMTPDIRDETDGIVKFAQNFDILTRPRSLTPYVSQVQADSSASTNQIRDFLTYTVSGTTYVYGRGVVSGTGKAKVFRKSDYTSSTWANAANSSASTGSATSGVFVEYHGFAYGSNTAGTIWKNDLSGSTAWDDANHTTSNSLPLSCNGIVHSKDDILYLAAKNVIISNNNGAWTDPALTLPSRYVVTSLCEYGDYLAIACKPLNAGKSVVYLWNRQSTLNTISEVIDFGTGNLQIIEQIEGNIIGISLRTEVATTGYTPSRLVFRSYSGGTADIFKEIVASSNVGLQLVYGQKINQRLYFLAGLTIDGTFRPGVWGVGKNKEGRWIVWLDRMPNNDTTVQTSNPLQGFYMDGDYTIISYFDSTSLLTQSNATSGTYTGSAIIETTLNPGMSEIDRTYAKQLEAIAVLYDILPANGQIILKYKIDGGSFITIVTETTDNAVVTEMTVDANGSQFTSGREYQFRIESTGGAIVRGMAYKYEALETNIRP